MSKYASGGSARLESAQKTYVIVDSILGPFSFNGFAPLTGAKLETIERGMANTKALLAKKL